MTIVITDCTDQPISPSELPTLNLWNDTLSHICATAIARLPSDHTGEYESKK